jgi:hypothetical protein
MEVKMQESWRDIPNFEGHYQVSDTGKIRSLKYRNKQGLIRVLKPHVGKWGYAYHILCKAGKRFTVKNHKAVMDAFVGPANGLHVNHIDGDKLNNNLDNLEYVTSQENTQHAVDIGLIQPQCGESHGNARLKASQVAEIRRLYKTENFTLKELGAMYSISFQHVSDIVNFRKWKTV